MIINEVIKALAEFRQEVSVEKTGVNPFYDSNYYQLEDVISAANTLPKFGLSWYQLHEGNDLVTYIFHMETGQLISSRVSLGEYQDSQKWGAANTYKRRIALITILGLSQPDDDANLTLSEKPKNLRNELDPSDFDYSGPPYRVFNGQDKIGAAFSDIKSWGAATKTALKSNPRCRTANIKEIKRVEAEVNQDNTMHHKTKEATLKAVHGVLAIAQGENNA